MRTMKTLKIIPIVLAILSLGLIPASASGVVVRECGHFYDPTDYDVWGSKNLSCKTVRAVMPRAIAKLQDTGKPVKVVYNGKTWRCRSTTRHLMRCTRKGSFAYANVSA